jgi:hypothetical protein
MTGYRTIAKRVTAEGNIKFEARNPKFETNPSDRNSKYEAETRNRQSAFGLDH